MNHKWSNGVLVAALLKHRKNTKKDEKIYHSKLTCTVNELRLTRNTIKSLNKWILKSKTLTENWETGVLILYMPKCLAP